MMKKGKTVATLYMLGMAAALISSAVAAAKWDANAPVQSAVSGNGCEARAKSHEQAAREMEAKAQEKKRLLEQYESKSYLYGRQAQDMQAHAHALARKYERAAKAHIREAALHRQVAMQLAEEPFCIVPVKDELNS